MSASGHFPWKLNVYLFSKTDLKFFHNSVYRHKHPFFFSSNFWTSNQAGELKLTFMPAVLLCCERFGVALVEGWNEKEREKCVCVCQNGDGGHLCNPSEIAGDVVPV